MTVDLYVGDCLDVLPTLEASSFHTCVTSPPYWSQRDYKTPTRAWPLVQFKPTTGAPSVDLPEWTGALGDEADPFAYVGHMVHVMRAIRRVLRRDASLWLNIGDTYVSRGGRIREMGRRGLGRTGVETVRRRYTKAETGIRNKSLAMVPSRVALALQADGWIVRADNVWYKPNATPDNGAVDRSGHAHEFVFHLATSERYFYDEVAVREQNQAGDGLRKRRTVWPVKTKSLKGQHSATFPPELADLCVFAGCPVGGRILDPFFGAGTVGLSAQRRGADVVGIELFDASAEQARKRLRDEGVTVVDKKVT